MAHLPRAHLHGPPSTTASAQGCEVCATVATVLQEGPTTSSSALAFSSLGQAVNLGTVGGYRRSGSDCHVCRTFFSELAAQCTTEPPDEHDVVEMTYLQFLRTWRLQIVPATPAGSTSSSFGFGLIRYVSQNPETPPSGLFEDEVYSVPVDRSSVSFDRIINWQAYCDANHGGTCHAIEDPWKRWESVDELLLVDVGEECLSRQPGSEMYLALSYVWGLEASPLIANRAIWDTLSEPRALASSSPLGRQLPRTIRDAMTVTSRLGYRYLWVDRLCIIQDDPSHKQHQLAAMAAIYANASLTIIASHGDDSEGLPGVVPGQSPQRRPFSTVSLASATGLLFDSSRDFGEPDKPPSGREHHRRGWTLQEKTLSNRTLDFGSREVRWECQRMRCREVLDDRRQLTDNRESSIELKLYRRFVDTSTYGYLARDFTGRLLTYDSDDVRAFSAIVAAFSRTMGDMLYGLPELLFEGMLLWHPREPLRARKRQPGAAPSWSFLGWAGNGLDLGVWDDLYNNRGRAGSTEQAFSSDHLLSSCVEFFKIDSVTGIRSPIRSAYTTKARQRLLGPSGGGGPQAPEKAVPETRHYLCVPIPTEPLPRATGSWLPILEFRTQRCRIRLGGIIAGPQGGLANGCADVALEDQSGRLVGALRLNSAGAGDDEGPGQLADLVVVSRCVASQPRAARMVPELRVFHSQCPQPCFVPGLCRADSRVVPYEFYNVIRVDWYGDVAYRMAAGRVLASYWDEQQPENVQIKLG